MTGSPVSQTFASGVDYQACDLGAPGFALSTSTEEVYGGNGGSGDYGVGGLGLVNSNGGNASGNGAGGGGASSAPNNTSTSIGGRGAPGLWIIEEYS
jgi:hypothetical protein